MKIQTLIALSLVSMGLTSVGVWALTAPTEAMPMVSKDRPIVSNKGPGPQFRVAGPVSIEARLGHRVLAADQSGTTYLLAEMTAHAGQVVKTPSPLDLAIVIDRSGSMRGQRLENAIHAAQGAVRRLREGDRVSIATYNTMVEEVLPVTTVSGNTPYQADSALRHVAAAGDTCISCGIEAGLTRLRGRTGMVKRILLLSDGEATAGIREESGFRSLAATCREAGISITSIGVDVEYNERVMALLATESNGRHYFVEHAAELPAVFDKEMESLNRTIATDAELVITLAPGVSVERVYDRVYRADSDETVVPLGTFAETERKTVLVALRTPPSKAGVLDIAKVELRYRDLTKDEQKQERGELALRLSSDPDEESDLDVFVENRLSRSRTGDALEEANALYRAGQMGQARAKLQAQLDSLNRVETRAKAKAGAPGKVNTDYERQRRALEEAEDGFEGAPAKRQPRDGTTAAPSPRPAVQVRRNQDYAEEAGY